MKDVEVAFVVCSRHVLDERFQFREDALAKPLEGKLPQFAEALPV